MKKPLMTLNLLLAPYIERHKKLGKEEILKKNLLNYFEVKDSKYARFSLLPQIHKPRKNVPGRPKYNRPK